MMIEESFFFYFIAAIIRAVQGKKTVGLLFRPKPAVEAKNFKLAIKKNMLNLLRKIESVSTLTIVPFYLNPKFTEIADDWIYDFQLWDLTDKQREEVEKYRNNKELMTLNNVTTEKATLVAIGRQDEDKGFDKFVEFYNVRSNEFNAVFGGKVTKELTSILTQFEVMGGISNNRFVTDSEVLQLYAMADFVWCVYSETYDQASGILGRAAQLGIPVIVRENSLMQQFCEQEGITYYLVDNLEAVNKNAECIPAVDFSRHSRQTLAKHLYIEI